MKKWIPLNAIYFKSCISVIVINIFLLLLYYDKLCTRTVVNDKNNCVDIGILYETLDKEKVKSLSGFYGFYIRSVIKLVDSGDTQKKLVGKHWSIYQSFQELRSSKEHPSEEVINWLVLFTL